MQLPLQAAFVALLVAVAAQAVAANNEVGLPATPCYSTAAGPGVTVQYTKSGSANTTTFTFLVQTATGTPQLTTFAIRLDDALLAHPQFIQKANPVGQIVTGGVSGYQWAVTAPGTTVFSLTVLEDTNLQGSLWLTDICQQDIVVVGPGGQTAFTQPAYSAGNAGSCVVFLGSSDGTCGYTTLVDKQGFQGFLESPEFGGESPELLLPRTAQPPAYSPQPAPSPYGYGPSAAPRGYYASPQPAAPPASPAMPLFGSPAVVSPPVSPPTVASPPPVYSPAPVAYSPAAPPAYAAVQPPTLAPASPPASPPASLFGSSNIQFSPRAAPPLGSYASPPLPSPTPYAYGSPAPPGGYYAPAPTFIAPETPEGTRGRALWELLLPSCVGSEDQAEPQCLDEGACGHCFESLANEKASPYTIAVSRDYSSARDVTAYTITLAAADVARVPDSFSLRVADALIEADVRPSMVAPLPVLDADRSPYLAACDDNGLQNTMKWVDIAFVRTGQSATSGVATFKVEFVGKRNLFEGELYIANGEGRAVAFTHADTATFTIQLAQGSGCLWQSLSL